MKKILSFIMAIVLAFCVVGCTCTGPTTLSTDNTDVEVVDSLGFVEQAISLDRQAMYLEVGSGDYRWFETGIVLTNWLDEENDGSFEMVVNVFQAVIEREQGADTWVYKFQHFDGDVVSEKVHGFWVEDLPMEDDAIKVSYREAFDKVMAVNLPKPHTRQVVLRKPLGPKACNPVWIFGNLRSQIYVDAVTGAVTSTNPAFDGLNLGTPLGEWP